MQRAKARMSARRRSDDRESDIAEICLALSAELRSGVPMGRAVAAVAADWSDLLGDVAGQVAIGGDVAAALRRTGQLPGAGALNAVAAAWDVAERTGAPLSRVLLAVADSLRMAAAARREAQSQLATARATARLMAILPFGTLLMLSGGDQAAVRFLVTTPVGWVCLGVAGALVSLGLWWVGRVSRTVTGTAWTA
jgi:tight adherence protein B